MASQAIRPAPARQRVVAAAVGLAAALGQRSAGGGARQAGPAQLRPGRS